jgi:hypothetical protein
MKQETSIEWLVRVLELESFENINLYSMKAIEQAKEMEKEQLILFGAQCMIEVEKESGLGAIRIYELYYNKTFKSE